MNARHTPLLPHQTDRLNKRRKRRGTRKFKNLSFRAMIRYFEGVYGIGDSRSLWIISPDGAGRKFTHP